jgi:DNA repair protein RadC
VYRLPVVRVALVREGTVVSETRVIRTPSDAAVVVRGAIGDYDREAFVVLLLNTKHRVVGVHIAGVGTLDSAPTGPREVFRAAILAGAKAVIFGHNHPSGDPTPSAADLHLTKRLVKAGDLLGIPVLDHVVIGETSHVSLREGDILRSGPESSP